MASFRKTKNGYEFRIKAKGLSRSKTGLGSAVASVPLPGVSFPHAAAGRLLLVADQR